MSGDGSVPAGWYHMQGDPTGTQRWWDGANWSANVHPPQAAAPVAEPAVAQTNSAQLAQVEQPTRKYGSLLAEELNNHWTSWDDVVKYDPAAQMQKAASSGGVTAQTQAPASNHGNPWVSPFKWMVLPYLHYADFKSRSCRAELWWFYLFSTVMSVVLFVVGLLVTGILVGEVEEGAKAAGSGVLLGFTPLALFVILSIVPSFAVQVRRLHDTDRSGWPLVLLPILPIVASLIVLVISPESAAIIALVYGLVSLYSLWLTVVIYFMPSHTSWNKYGASHLRPR